MKRQPLSLSGVFPPLPTPFDRSGRVAHDELATNIARWNDQALAGYVILGSNGEAAYLAGEEKTALFRAARAAIPEEKLFIAGTGCESTGETIALTRSAADAGADAALVITPSFYASRMTPQALVAHYESIAGASPIPIIVYNVPKFTGIDLDAATIARLGAGRNIIGVKDSSGNIGKLGDVVRRADPDFQVLAGTASFFFAALGLGARGGIVALANVAPAEVLEIERLFKQADWAGAAALQRRLLPVDAAITARFGIPGLKAALDLLGYYGGPCRPPLQDLADADRALVRTILVEGEILK